MKSCKLNFWAKILSVSDTRIERKICWEYQWKAWENILNKTVSFKSLNNCFLFILGERLNYLQYEKKSDLNRMQKHPLFPQQGLLQGFVFISGREQGHIIFAFLWTAANCLSWLSLFPTEATMASIYHKLTPHVMQNYVSHCSIQRDGVNKNHVHKPPSNQKKKKGKRKSISGLENEEPFHKLQWLLFLSSSSESVN